MPKTNGIFYGMALHNKRQTVYLYILNKDIIIIYDVIVKETLFRIVPLLKMGKKLQMRAKNFNNEKLGQNTWMNLY